MHLLQNANSSNIKFASGCFQSLDGYWERKSRKGRKSQLMQLVFKKTFQVLVAETSRDVDQLNVKDESGSAGDLSGHLDYENDDDDDDN